MLHAIQQLRSQFLKFKTNNMVVWVSKYKRKENSVMPHIFRSTFFYDKRIATLEKKSLATYTFNFTLLMSFVVVLHMTNIYSAMLVTSARRESKKEKIFNYAFRFTLKDIRF